MPRNRTKNAYVTIGIPYASKVYRLLLQESHDTGISLAKLIPVKLNAYYAGITAAPVHLSEEAPKPLQRSEAEANALAFLAGEED